MDIAKGDLVIATVGRERGDLFLVIEAEHDRLLLADGRHRRLEAPKRKNRRHVRRAGAEAPELAAKIRSSEIITNSELRKALAVIRGGIGNQDQEG